MDKIITIRDNLANIPMFTPNPVDSANFDHFTALSESDVGKLVMSMATKSCELDTLPTFLLKKIMPHALPLITSIINESLISGRFVDKWKTAIIRPSLKKPGLDLVPSNYRPVSNLGFLSKLLEKAALSQFIVHTNNNALIPDYQSAYRQFYSCETALLKVFDDLLWSMEHQRITALVAVDLSAAFDTVDHTILLSVLQNRYGISGQALQWFDSYLRPRSCVVKVGRQCSNERDLSFSVPQGSCMGPILYLAYASTLKDVVPHSIDLHGYADDHALKLSFSANDRDAERQAIIDLQNCAQSVNTWMNENRLKMNPSKTEFVMFGSIHQLNKCKTDHLVVCNSSVVRSKKVKYLGAILDESLTLKEHIASKCKTAMWNIQRIKHIRRTITKDACETLVLGLVMSHLDYSNVLFVGLPDCDIDRLQRVPNIVAKLVLSDGDSSQNSLKRLHWLPIKLRIKHKVLTIVYKCLHDQAPQYLADLIKIDKPRRSGLRSESTKKLVIPPTKRKTFADRSFSVAGPIFWNDLPDYLKSCETVDVFKRKLKTHLFDEF